MKVIRKREFFFSTLIICLNLLPNIFTLIANFIVNIVQPMRSGIYLGESVL